MKEDRAILRVVDLPVRSGRLVLYDWSDDQTPRLQNLVRIDRDGAVMWIAELPENTVPDCFVSVMLEADIIKAGTWSCYSIMLDPATGRIQSQIFVK